jgi:hypothetical protein
MRKWPCLSALALGAAVAAGRPDLNGTWQLDRSHSETGDDKLKSETLDIQQTEDSIQIADAVIDTDGRERKSAIQCNTMGKECKVKGELVSSWYNGPTLVIMETWRANEVVVKKSLKQSADGRTLNIEVIHIAPPGEKNEILAFTRQAVTAAAKR